MLDFVNVGKTNPPLCQGHTGPLRCKWAGRLSRSERTSGDFSHTWGMGPGFYRKMCWKYLKRISSVGFCVFLMNLRQAMQSSMATSLYTFSVTNLCSFDLRCKPRWKGLHPSNFDDIQVYVVMKKFHWNITSKSFLHQPILYDLAVRDFLVVEVDIGQPLCSVLGHWHRGSLCLLQCCNKFKIDFWIKKKLILPML